MRANSPARLAVALFLGVAAAAPFELAECLSSKAAKLASFAACGHAGSIEYCLANRLPADSQLCTPDVLAQCFINAGCQPDEARIEAVWTIKRCEHGVEENELRRRSPAPAPADADTSSEKTATAKTTASEKTTTTAKTTSTEATTAETTATTASAETTASAASTATSTATTPTSTKVNSYTGTTTSSLVCETTTTITTKTCPTQSTGTASGKQMSCFSTQQSYPTCAAGLLCTTSDSGVTNCMKKQGADAAGIVIAIVFGAALVIAVATLCFFCCRDRRQDARLTKAAEAAAIARQAVIDSKKARAATAPAISVSASADSQPLMAQQGYDHNDQHDQHQQAYAPQYHSAVSNSDLRSSETGGDIAGPNPFADQHGLR
ncbi:hypothetical protein F503_06860 [Ophiostoma piceae UAMH 11346]|uniref:Uncharacterized protein n=1 Tax=Ophiostoma piceae (strain UAMH 11346) TaxID=1262450 RepID=S3C6B3_OPHP1|nr:hypothetical protein F503_06860 [Ophiostoma piceae UAMH 11346]